MSSFRIYARRGTQKPRRPEPAVMYDDRGSRVMQSEMNEEIEMAESGFSTPVIRVIDCHIARVIEGRTEFLLLLRSPDKIYADMWRMVGGKIKAQETAWQAALREVREETSLTVKELLSVPYLNRFYEWQHDRVNEIPVFLALVDGQDPQLDEEHVDFAWLPMAEAANRLPWPGQREGLFAAQRLLDAQSPLRDILRVEMGTSAASARPQGEPDSSS